MMRVISRKREVLTPVASERFRLLILNLDLNSPAAERSNKLESNLVLNEKVLVQ